MTAAAAAASSLTQLINHQRVGQVNVAKLVSLAENYEGLVMRGSSKRQTSRATHGLHCTIHHDCLRLHHHLRHLPNKDTSYLSDNILQINFTKL